MKEPKPEVSAENLTNSQAVERDCRPEEPSGRPCFAMVGNTIAPVEEAGRIDQTLPPPLILSVVVPCFNEEESIEELYRRVSRICRDTVDEAFELVLINDGSSDRTWEIINQLCASDSRVVGVDLSRNHGQQLAQTAGLALCQGERVLILDADLQDPPELLSEMMRLMDAGADVVLGKRRSRAGESFFKEMSSASFYRVFNRLARIEIPRHTGDFRLMRRSVVEVLNRMPERHRYMRGMVSWLGFRQVALEFDRKERYAGKTKYPLRRMISFALDAITSFSTLPLRIASVLGLIFAGLALISIIFALYNWAFGSVVPGWTSVMIVVLLLSGIQLTVMGVMGEYIGRLYMESKHRPLFIIKSVVRGDRKP